MLGGTSYGAFDSVHEGRKKTESTIPFAYRDVPWEPGAGAASRYSPRQHTSLGLSLLNPRPLYHQTLHPRCEAFVSGYETLRGEAFVSGHERLQAFARPGPLILTNVWLWLQVARRQRTRTLSPSQPGRACTSFCTRPAIAGARTRSWRQL